MINNKLPWTNSSFFSDPMSSDSVRRTRKASYPVVRCEESLKESLFSKKNSASNQIICNFFLLCGTLKKFKIF